MGKNYLDTGHGLRIQQKKMICDLQQVDLQHVKETLDKGSHMLLLESLGVTMEPFVVNFYQIDNGNLLDYKEEKL